MINIISYPKKNQIRIQEIKFIVGKSQTNKGINYDIFGPNICKKRT